MNLFHYATNLIIELEGGDTLHTHPNDPGGTTKFGISQRAHPNVHIPSLTRGQAKNIYRRHYWEPVEERVTEPAMQLLVFDAAVQHGTPTALAWLKTHPTFDAYMSHRIQYYTHLNTWSTFGRGWMNRISRIMMAANDLRTKPQDVNTIIDHRPRGVRIRQALTGRGGRARVRLRPMTAGKGLKLDLDT